MGEAESPFVRTYLCTCALSLAGYARYNATGGTRHDGVSAWISTVC